VTKYEVIAKAFHDAYETLAPSFGYETRRESAVPWEDVPEQNRALMTATVEAIIDDIHCAGCDGHDVDLAPPRGARWEPGEMYPVRKADE
jgi:hypothetical protein